MVKIKQLFPMLWPEVGFGSQKTCATRKNTSIYKSSVIWNSVKSVFKIDDPATSVSILKLKLKAYLLNKQLLGDAMLKIG